MDELVSKSVLMLTPKQVAVELDNVLNDEDVQKNLGEQKLVECQGQRCTWSEMYERLEDSGIPCSVVNTDLRRRNFALPRKTKGDAGTIMLFDWGIGCLAHPFSTLHHLRNTKKVTDAHVESYLLLWTRFILELSELKKIEKLATWVSNGVSAVQAWKEAQVCEHAAELSIVPVGRANRDTLLRVSARYIDSLRKATQTYVKQYQQA